MSDPDMYIKNGDRAPVCRFYTKALRHGASFTYTASDRCGKWVGFPHIFVLLSCGFTPTGEHYLSWIIPLWGNPYHSLFIDIQYEYVEWSFFGPCK